MGPSGLGKTTLLLMLGALLRPTAGSIAVTGRDRRGVDIAAAPENAAPGLRARTSGSSSRTTPCSRAHRHREHRASPRTSPAHRRPPPTAAPRSCSTGSGSRHRRGAARPAVRRREATGRRRPRAWPTTPPSCSPTSPPPTSTPPAAATSPGCCAGSPTRTAARSSSSATTTGCARSPTGSCGSRTARSASSPRMAVDPVCRMQVEPTGPTPTGTAARCGSAPTAAATSSPPTHSGSSPGD